MGKSGGIWFLQPALTQGAQHMFRGIAEISIDSKGRLAIPAKYREVLAAQCCGQLVVTVDLVEACLRLYPLPIWQEIEQQLEKLPANDPNSRRVQRLLIGHASDVELDGSGRVLVPASLRKRAGLEKDVVLVGQGQKFELWSVSAWEAYNGECAESFAAVPDVLANIAF